MVKKYDFSIGTRYINSEWHDEIELEFDDDATDEMIEEIVDETYQEWLNENNTGGYYEIE